MKRYAMVLATCGILAGSAGPSPAQSDATIRPFTIDVADAVLADLKTRLENARVPAP